MIRNAFVASEIIDLILKTGTGRNCGARNSWKSFTDQFSVAILTYMSGAVSTKTEWHHRICRDLFIESSVDCDQRLRRPNTPLSLCCCNFTMDLSNQRDGTTQDFRQRGLSYSRPVLAVDVVNEWYAVYEGYSRVGRHGERSLCALAPPVFGGSPCRPPSLHPQISLPKPLASFFFLQMVLREHY